jgi:hypothetical protein
MNFPDYRYEQLITMIFAQRIPDFHAMYMLPERLRANLAETFGSSVCGLVPVAHKASSQADKVLFQLKDGNCVETVNLHYKKGWESFCISSQCGCGFGCKFCATGTIGHKRNMTADEITDQILYFYLAGHKINSVSFMGMGEPFAKSLLSYAVGCMFGRYSLDVEGLAYAGGEWDASKYKTFIPDEDNIIPICDDEYFEDDITGRFVKFIETVYGKDTLDESLRFIADALGGSGQPKDVIRNYFLNDFYADHLKIYQKRPIYWLFDSGKKNGFKALIYMHRYAPDTLARMRTDYVHEQQARYRTAIADVEHRMENASASERVKLNKQLAKLQDQAEEIRLYEEKIHHLADQMIRIDLDDGVNHNYAIFEDVLAKIK